MKFNRLIAALAVAFACSAAHAQTSGSVTNHAFALGKGAGFTGYTSLLCTSAQLAVGQTAADPICQTITGDVTISAAGVTAIGATVVHSSMLNADVFSTAHSWSATQSFPNNSLTLAEFPTIGANTVLGSVAGGTPAALTQAQITAMINLATASLNGALPAWPNNTTTYFRGDGTYATHNFASLGGQATFAQFPTGVSDTAIGYWGSTVASALAINNCSNALTYSTTTHSFGCNSTAGTGTVTSVGLTNTYGLSVSGSPVTTSGNISAGVNLTTLSNILGANVLLNNTANYFDGPSVAQGTSGTWFASGSMSLSDNASATFLCKLWDGTTIISTGAFNSSGTNVVQISLSGILASPAGNIRISCRDSTSTGGLINFNASGNSKDSSLSVHRIQ